MILGGPVQRLILGGPVQPLQLGTVGPGLAVKVVPHAGAF